MSVDQAARNAALRTGPLAETSTRLRKSWRQELTRISFAQAEFSARKYDRTDKPSGPRGYATPGDPGRTRLRPKNYLTIVLDSPCLTELTLWLIGLDCDHIRTYIA